MRSTSWQDVEPVGIVDLLRAERVKIISTRGFRVALAVAGGLGLAVGGAVHLLLRQSPGPDTGADYVLLLCGRSLVVPLVAGVFGAAVAGSEYRYGGIHLMSLVMPRRHLLLSAELIAAALCATAFDAALMAGGGVFGLAYLDRLGSVAAVAWSVLVSFLVAAAAATLGVCVAWLARSQLVGVGTMIAEPLAIEPVAAALLSSRPGHLAGLMAECLPWAAARNAFVIGGRDGGQALVAPASLHGPVAAAVLLLWVAAVATTAYRDALNR